MEFLVPFRMCEVAGTEQIDPFDLGPLFESLDGQVLATALRKAAVQVEIAEVVHHGVLHLLV